MERIIDFSLALLRSVLFPNVLHRSKDGKLLSEPLEDEQWKEVAESFSRQSLDGLLPDAISLLPATLQPSKNIKMSLIARQLQVERMNRAMNDELLAFTEVLHSRNIPYLLLKGQGVAAFYPNPQHRVCGDIDLYVPKEYLQEVHRGLIAFGATRTAETRHHINYWVNGVEWELHHCIYYFQKGNRNLQFMQYVDESMKGALMDVRIGEGKVCVLPPTMNVLLLLSHIVNHFYCEGIGLRQLCDYARLLHHEREGINREELLHMLDALSLTRAYRVFGYIVVHYLGMPEDALALQPTAKDIRLAQRVIVDCLKGGNFGRNDHMGRGTLWTSMIFYARFFRRLWNYRQLHTSEALWWPLAKIRRAIKGEVNVSEERSVLRNCETVG